MPTPWLSILIPVYNVQPYLAECVESVMQQADEGVEVLLLNDCSTDASPALMQELAQRWPGRLRLLQHAHNQGPSAARNSMIDAAQGDYLWFLDSDDKLLPGAIPALKHIVERHAHPDVVLCDFQFWREKMRLKHRLRGERHRRSFEGPSRVASKDVSALMAGLLLPGQLHAWSKISRRALWTPDLRFPTGKYFEDMATMPRLALRAKSFYYEPEPWVAYRQRDSSILASMTLRKAADLSEALGLFSQELARTPLEQDEKLRFALSHLSARNLIGAMRQLSSMSAADTLTEREAAANSFRQHFLNSAPLSATKLLQAYRRRGWWLRGHKFRKWLDYHPT